MNTIQTSRTVIRRGMLVQLALLTFIALSLLTSWASAQEPDCERRALANDVAGQHVVTCKSGKVTAPRGTARKLRSVRHVVGSTTIRTYTRVGVTTIVARMGARLASR
jgi:hypothetical protein